MRDIEVSIAFRLGWSLRPHGGFACGARIGVRVSIAFRLGWSLRQVRYDGAVIGVRALGLNRLSAWVVPPTLAEAGPNAGHTVGVSIAFRLGWSLRQRPLRLHGGHAGAAVSIAFRLGWSLRLLHRQRRGRAGDVQSQSPFGLGGPSDARTRRARRWPVRRRRVSIAFRLGWSLRRSGGRRTQSSARGTESQSPFGLGGPSDAPMTGNRFNIIGARVSIAFRLGWSLRRRRCSRADCGADGCLNRLSAWVVPPTCRPRRQRVVMRGHVSIAFRLGWSLRLAERGRDAATQALESQSPFGLGGPSDRRATPWSPPRSGE